MQRKSDRTQGWKDLGYLRPHLTRVTRDPAHVFSPNGDEPHSSEMLVVIRNKTKQSLRGPVPCQIACSVIRGCLLLLSYCQSHGDKFFEEGSKAPIGLSIHFWSS